MKPVEGVLQDAVSSDAELRAFYEMLANEAKYGSGGSFTIVRVNEAKRNFTIRTMGGKLMTYEPILSGRFMIEFNEWASGTNAATARHLAGTVCTVKLNYLGNPPKFEWSFSNRNLKKKAKV